MKKISALSFSAFALFFAVSSCKKEPVDVTKIINVELKLNEKYSYTIPHAGDADDVMEITQQAMHSFVTKITPDAAGNALFEYVPSQNFSGTDEVQVASVEEHHDHHGNGQRGNCNGRHHGHDDSYTYIFKFNITGTTATASTSR